MTIQKQKNKEKRKGEQQSPNVQKGQFVFFWAVTHFLQKSCETTQKKQNSNCEQKIKKTQNAGDTRKKSKLTGLSSE